MRLLTCAADPAALREGLRDLAVASESKTLRTLAAIGPLPGTEREALMDLGRFLVRLDISVLVVVGDAGPVHAGAVLEGSWGAESRHVATEAEALALLRAERPGAVLVAGLPGLLAELEASA